MVDELFLKLKPEKWYYHIGLPMDACGGHHTISLKLHDTNILTTDTNTLLSKNHEPFQVQCSNESLFCPLHHWTRMSVTCPSLNPQRSPFNHFRISVSPSCSSSTHHFLDFLSAQLTIFSLFPHFLSAQLTCLVVWNIIYFPYIGKFIIPLDEL